MLPEPGVTVRRPMVFQERHFCVTGLDNGVRLAGTVEFAGTGAPMNPRRSDVLYDLAKHYLPGIEKQHSTRWMGFRPSLPDSLPAMGRGSKYENLFYCFGHQHLGLDASRHLGKSDGGAHRRPRPRDRPDPISNRTFRRHSMIHRNFIAGDWREGSDVYTNVNPSNTADIVGEYAIAGARDAAAAALAARDAFHAWSRSGIQQRFDILDASAPRSSRARTSSGGCCRAKKARRCPKASAKRRAPAHIFKFFAGEALRHHRREAAFGAPGRRRRDHARARRRGRR